MRFIAMVLAPFALIASNTAVYAAGLPVIKDTLTTTVAKDNLPKTKLNGASITNGSSERRKSVFDDPLAGVVVNRTITVLGQDFYQAFTTQWRQKDINNQFTISIHERPSARFGSEIWVQFRQKRMFHTFLPPARAATKRISAMAVEMVYQNIADSEVERLMVKSPDLGPEEM